MEVHAHTHTARKKWTHYFWEFLMLFLAVFCGFLAENQREHYVEAQRAKEYAKSLLNDLRNDTVELHHGIHQTRFFTMTFDSSLAIGLRNNRKNEIHGTFYYYSRFSTNAFFIDWHTSTLVQLLQSGNLRYFRNKELVNKINNYYALQGLIASFNLTDREHRARIMDIRNQILEARYFSVFAALIASKEEYGQMPNEPTDRLMTQSLPLQPGGAGLMQEFLNHLSDRKYRYKTLFETHYINAVKAAEDIMNLLIEEYHLK